MPPRYIVWNSNERAAEVRRQREMARAGRQDIPPQDGVMDTLNELNNDQYLPWEGPSEW